MNKQVLNQVLHGNCVEVLDKQLPENYVDMVVSSPPYDNLRTYKGFKFNHQDIIKSLYRVMKPGGIVVWVVGDSVIEGSETGTSFRQALDFISAGFNLHDTMIYEKNTSSFPARAKGNRYTQIFEYMFVFSKKKIYDLEVSIDEFDKLTFPKYDIVTITKY